MTPCSSIISSSGPRLPRWSAWASGARSWETTPPPRGFAIYLAVLFLTAGLMAGAGYWGGELILNS